MNDVFEQRQAFNFYRSYYEISLLLDKENRAEFLDSILHYQFTGELKNPTLPMALLAFSGQIHSLKKQVIGFQRGKETYPNGNPTKGKDKGSYKEVQEKEKEKEKEEVQVKEKEENDLQPTAKEKSFKNLSETEFYQTIKEFSEKYPSKMLREFFDYWREPMANKKMRMTGEKAWDLSRRLSTWNNRNSNKNSNGNNTINPTNTDGTRNLALARRR